MGVLKAPHAWTDRPTAKEIMRFMSHVKKLRCGCWVWTGCLDENGYGRFRWRGKTVWVTRFSFAAFKGPIPAHRHINHIIPPCKHHSCINPDHINLLTPSANSREMYERKKAKEVLAVCDAPF